MITCFLFGWCFQNYFSLYNGWVMIIEKLIEGLKKSFKDNFVTLLIFSAYSIVLNNKSMFHLENVPGGESIASLAIFLFFAALIVISSYIMKIIFDKCVKITFASDQIQTEVDSKLSIQLKKYDPATATYNFSIKVIPNEEKLNLTRELLGRLNHDCALNNIHFQVFWEPKDALNIVPNNVSSYLTLKDGEDGYPYVSLKDISSAKEIKYSMKVSSTNLMPEFKSIRFKIRKICFIEPGNTQCSQDPIKSSRHIDYIPGCRIYYKFINFDLKSAQGTVFRDMDV